MNDNLNIKGDLGVKLVRADGKELTHPTLLSLFERIEKGVDDSLISAAEFFQVNLVAHHFDKDGKLYDHSDTHVTTDDGGIHLGSGLVTTAGVNLLAADWTNATATLKLANYHDSGTGTTAAAIGDTTLQTATGNARVAGVQSNPVAGQYKTVSTLPYTATAAITEWGLLTASSAGTLWDHKVFAAINVVSGDSIQYTYTLTVNSGG